MKIVIVAILHLRGNGGKQLITHKYFWNVATILHFWSDLAFVMTDHGRRCQVLSGMVKGANYISSVFSDWLFIQGLMWTRVPKDVHDKEHPWEHNCSSLLLKTNSGTDLWWRNVAGLVLQVLNVRSQFLLHCAVWTRSAEMKIYLLNLGISGSRPVSQSTQWDTNLLTIAFKTCALTWDTIFGNKDKKNFPHFLVFYLLEGKEIKFKFFNLGFARFGITK